MPEKPKSTAHPETTVSDRPSAARDVPWLPSRSPDGSIGQRSPWGRNTPSWSLRSARSIRSISSDRRWETCDSVPRQNCPNWRNPHDCNNCRASRSFIGRPLRAAFSIIRAMSTRTSTSLVSVADIISSPFPVKRVRGNSPQLSGQPCGVVAIGVPKWLRERSASELLPSFQSGTTSDVRE